MKKLKITTALLFVFALLFAYGCANLALPNNDIFSQSPNNTTIGSLPRVAQLNKNWDMANSLLEIGVAAAGIFGGAYGLRIARALKDAHDKSKALQEVIAGNEIFKAQNVAAKESFKSAHQSQSQKTKTIVSQLKYT